MAKRFETTVLRDTAKNLLAAAGMPIELVTGGHGANQRYRIKLDAAHNAGKLVRLRTNNVWAVMDYASGSKWDDAIASEDADFVCAVCVNPQGEIEVYFVPAARMSADMKAGFKAFSERKGHRTKGNDKIRVLYFSEDSTRPWFGYCEKYAAFKLGRPSTPARITPSPMGPSRPGGDVIERARRMVADAFGVPISGVRISVDFTMPAGLNAPDFTSGISNAH